MNQRNSPESPKKLHAQSSCFRGTRLARHGLGRWWRQPPSRSHQALRPAESESWLSTRPPNSDEGGIMVSGVEYFSAIAYYQSVHTPLSRGSKCACRDLGCSVLDVRMSL